LYQQQISGAWYLPTYGRIDVTPPTLSRIQHHLSYYFGHEYAAKDNWALAYAAAGFAGFGLLLPSRSAIGTFGLSWRRVALTAVTLWVIPTLFFLSHAVHGLHYAMPTTFAVVTVVGFASLAMETNGTTGPAETSKVSLLLGLLLIGVSAFGALRHAWLERTVPPVPAQPIAHVAQPLPAEVANDHAWVWADYLTGTLWYYYQKPAFKIAFSDPPTRATIFKFVFDRGEPQYLIRDSVEMEVYMEEIRNLGGTLERKGDINGQPYFLITWPKDGPLPIAGMPQLNQPRTN